MYKFIHYKFYIINFNISCSANVLVVNYFSLGMFENVFCLHFWKILSLGIEIYSVDMFFPQCFEDGCLFTLFLTNNLLSSFSLLVVLSFPPCYWFQGFPFIFALLKILIMMCLCVVFFMLLVLCWTSWICVFIVFIRLGKNMPLFLQIFLCLPFSFRDASYN